MAGRSAIVNEVEDAGFAGKAEVLVNLETNTPDIARMLGMLANKERIRILCRLVASKKELSIAALAAGTHIAAKSYARMDAHH